MQRHTKYPQFIAITVLPCLLLFAVSSIGCNERNAGSSIHTSASANDSATHVITGADTLGWLNSFRDFRTAVYQNDRSRVKQFFSFPINSEHNEIWYLVYAGNEQLIDKLPSSIKPFTKQDFDKYYTRLFPRAFINVLLKVKSEELYRTGNYETIELHDDSATSYRMYATVDKEAQTLTLNLASNTTIGGDNDDSYAVESNVIYEFSIIENRRIIFKQVRLAG